MNPYIIYNNTIETIFYMKNKEKMKASTAFPQLSGSTPAGIDKINAHFRTDAANQQTFIAEQILKPLLEDMPETNSEYEWKSDYNITYNNAPFISMYSDAYQYTGGAHGLTVRKSENCNAVSGEALSLSEFFPEQSNYEELIKKEIIRQIGMRQKENPDTYFENYPALVGANFKADNYYIKAEPERLIFYFQQYEIAPYSTGIPEFVIPIKKQL